ncbi:MAG: 23S rRNA (guanosine(2251)-2'-O)-methyltransferase RlmB [Thermodesulfobacteriota bacterium]
MKVPNQTKEQNRKKPSAGQEPFRWAWGKQAVLELLRVHPERVGEVIMAPPELDPERREIAELCTRLGIPFSIKQRKQIDRLLSVPAHQAVAARLKEDPALLSLESLLSGIPLDQKPAPVLLALDHILDPQNLGAMIRTALSAGVRGVILPKDRSCPISGTVRKAAAGALEHMPLIQVTNLVRSLEMLKKKGFWILSLEAHSLTSLYEIDLQVPLVVVIGGEAQGVGPLVRKHSDWVASIPMKGVVSSLNASVACGVVLYEILRKNQFRGPRE